MNNQSGLKPSIQNGYPQLDATLTTYAHGWTIISKRNHSRSRSSFVSTWTEGGKKPNKTKSTNLISEKLTLISASSVIVPWMLSENCGLTKLRPSFKQYNKRYKDFNVSLIEYSRSLKLWWREAGGLVVSPELVVWDIINWKSLKVRNENMPKNTRVRAARKTGNTHRTRDFEISVFRIRGETGLCRTCSSGILLKKNNKFNRFSKSPRWYHNYWSSKQKFNYSVISIKLIAKCNN